MEGVGDLDHISVETLVLEATIQNLNVDMYCYL